ncbi:MAG: DUF1311 domain-containing protein [Rhizobiales bacterium]|nr:DUF1311 domain-containing protein [Hyphomicrobiales bacterium]
MSAPAAGPRPTRDAGLWRRSLAVLGALLCTFIVAPASPALDCGKAATAVETAICADPDLRAAEDRLDAAYGEVRRLSSDGERTMLVRAQRHWLAEREANCPASALGLQGCIGDMTGVKTAELEGGPGSGPGSGSRIIPYYVFQDGSESAYAIQAQFFRFAEPRSAGEKAFNAAMAKTSGNYKIGPHGEDTGGRTYEIQTFSVLNYASDRLISATVNEWSFTGGAHGNGISLGINIDLSSGREIEIADILSEAAFPALMQECRSQIVAEKMERFSGEPYDPATDEFLKDEVIAEHLATMAAWSLAETEATVGFDPYAIGPYAEGSYACVFPMAELRKLAPPGAPLP